MAGFVLLLFVTCMLIRGCKPNEQFTEPSINLYRAKENKSYKLTLEEYIQGVVAAEMPASFELEALKARQ